MNWYIYCIKNYANFSGRGRRKEYWMFFLFNTIIFTCLGVLSNLISDYLDTNEGFILMGVYALFIIIPHLAAVVWRLHDINKSGAYWFVRFIPLIGPIWLLILLVEDSWDATNKYGVNPKDPNIDHEINSIGTE